MFKMQREVTPTTRKRVLIVDDDRAITALLVALFGMKGYEPLSEADVLVAKKRLQTEPFDLIILDLNLWHGNGLDLLDYLRQGLHLTVPVIILSAMHQESILIRSFELGANDYIVKPFDPADLLKRVGLLCAN